MILSGNQVKKWYDLGEVRVDALRGVDFAVKAGEFVVIQGYSGSGKTTLLNIIGGMEAPSAGEVYYRGQAVHLMNERERTLYRRQGIGFVFQFYNLMSNLTAWENVQLSVEIAPDPLPADEVLREVGLAGRLDHFPSQLSGGEQQRVAIARALAKNSDLLLCDEPTGALDVETGIQVLGLLCRFNRERGKTLVVITHNPQIGKLADRIMFLKDGLIVKNEVNLRPLRPEEVAW